MTQMSGGEVIARILEASGAEYVFGLHGGQTPFTMTVIKSGMKWMSVRDEKCASLMATGYSIVSGKAGICSATGIGAAHLALGMHEAYCSSYPLIAITNSGSPASAWRLGEAHGVDQEVIFRPVTKWMVSVQALETLPDIMRRALKTATTGSPGPVAIVVPGPILAGQADFEIRSNLNATSYPGLRIAPDAEAIERAAELLLEANNPVIVAGGGVLLSRAFTELRELAELLSIPVATTHIAHGTFPDKHPLSVGVLGGPCGNGRGRVANRIVEQADVVLLVGTRVESAATRGWRIPSPKSKIIQIDIDPAVIGNNYWTEVSIVADAKLALQALKNALRRRERKPVLIESTPKVKEIAALMKEWRDEFTPQMTSDAVPIKTPRLFREIQPFIDEGVILMNECGPCSYWAANYLDASPDNLQRHARGYPALGSGFPMAMGAQAAAPNRRVLCISGDGAFGYNIMALETAVRLNLPVVNVIINNHTFGMERASFPRFGFEVQAEAVDFSPQNFAKIAEAYNCFGVRVEKPREIRKAITAAFASGKPAIVDVLIDPKESDSDELPWG